MLRISISRLSQHNLPRAALNQSSRRGNVVGRISPFKSMQIGSNDYQSSLIPSIHHIRYYQVSRCVRSEENATENSTTPKKAEASTGESIRSAMRQFLFRVHPDFFSKYPSVQQSNERALKQINQLLDILEDYTGRSGPIILDPNRVPKKLTVSFFLRETKTVTTDETSDIEASSMEPSQSGKKKGEKQFRNVTSTLSFPESFFNTPFPRQRLDHDCRVFINSLLKQASLPTVELPDIGISSEKSKKGEKQQGQGGGMEKRDKVLWAHEMRSMINKALNRHYTLDQMVMDSLGGRMILERGPDKLPYELEEEERLAFEKLYQYRDNTFKLKRSVFFVPQLTGEQKGMASRALDLLWASKRIPDDIPVLITQNSYFTPSQVEGFITLPHNFYLEKPLNPPTLQEDPKKEDADPTPNAGDSTGSPSSKLPQINVEQYLSMYLPTIIQQRGKLRDAIVETELGLSEILETLKVADVIVKVGLFDARPVINRILKAIRTLSTLDDEQRANDAAARRESVVMEKEGTENDESKKNASSAADTESSPFHSETESEITDEMEDEFMKDLQFGTKPVEQDKAKKKDSPKATTKKSKTSTENQLEDAENRHEPVKFAAMDLLRNVTMHIVKGGGNAEYDADRDVFIVPATISTDGFKAALAEHRPMLEMRQRLNPHALEFASEYWTLLGIIGKLSGVREIVLDGPAVKNKIIQVHGAQTLKRHAPELRAMNLKKIGLVISDKFDVDLKQQLIFVPPVFEMTDLHEFLSRSAAGQHLRVGRPFQ